MILISVFAFFLLLLALPALYFHILVYLYRKRDKYPLKGKAEKGDIVRLVKDRKRILAMRAYRDLHRCGLIEAKHGIKQLEKEIRSGNLKKKSEPTDAW